jgi:hypothetical protein
MIWLLSTKQTKLANLLCNHRQPLEKEESFNMLLISGTNLKPTQTAGTSSLLFVNMLHHLFCGTVSNNEVTQH